MIARMGKTRFIICAALVLVVCAAMIVAACGLNLPEATGKTVKTDGKMTIDCSNMSEGYIMVKAKDYQAAETADCHIRSKTEL